MSEKRPWTWLRAALTLWAGLIMFALAMPAVASPIYPNIKKVASESQASPAQFAPARAGWDGTEMPQDEVRTDLDSAAILRGNKAALLTAAIPDPRAVLAVIVVIFLMRMLRKIQQQQREQVAAGPAIDASNLPEERKAA